MVSGGRCEKRAVEILQRRHAQQLQVVPDVVAQRLQELDDGRLATPGQCDERWTTETDGSSTERDSGNYVSAGSNTAIDNDIDVGADTIDDRWKHVDRRRNSIELAAAVIGDVNARSARVARPFGVVGSEDTLDPHWQRR